MVRHYTARYTKLEHGYMGQLVEWPEVVTEGENLEDCRTQLQDALHEMILACHDMNVEVPGGGALFEPITAEV